MSKNSVVIVDTGVGNFYNITRALLQVGVKSVVSSDVTVIESAERVVIPGVGAFASVMSYFKKNGIDSALVRAAESGVPILGICLGMQLLLTRGHEDGITTGLGLVEGEVIPLPNVSVEGTSLRIPHMGWSQIEMRAQANVQTGWQTVDSTIEVYFAHSYVVDLASEKNVAATFRYGGYPFVAALNQKNIWGVQFHPERSGIHGLQILSAFGTT
jgi:glutamine amidotransferase